MASDHKFLFTIVIFYLVFLYGVVYNLVVLSNESMSKVW